MFLNFDELSFSRMDISLPLLLETGRAFDPLISSDCIDDNADVETGLLYGLLKPDESIFILKRFEF